MRRFIRFAAMALLACGSLSGNARAQSISTAVSNNANGSIFLDLTAAANPLIVTGLQVQISQATYPFATSIQVWTRPGTYVGNTGASTGWTLTQTIYATATSGTVNTATLDLPSQIQIAAGSTVGVYLQTTTTNNMRVTGTNSIVPTTTFSNADITVFTNTSRSGTTAFGGTQTTNRAFAGTIIYVQATGTGACCTSAGVCAIDTPANCLAAGSMYQGPGTACDPTPCPVGSCCSLSGACTLSLRVNCTGPSMYNTTPVCGAPCPQGACCKPDGSCVINFSSACTTLAGFHNGENSACPSGVLCYPDVEPNNAKAEAPIIVVDPGVVIRGHSSGTTTTVGSTADGTVDTYRLKMAAAPSGIYEYKATASTAVANVNGAIVGFAQTAATAAPWSGTLGTAGAEANVQVAYNTSPSTDRINMWYGFGKQEELYYRVSAGVGSLANYNIAFERTPVTPTDLGNFATGTIDIFTTGVVPVTNDSALAVFDSNFNPIPGYSNFNQSVNSYPGSAAQNFNSYLRRTYAPGVYYLASSIGDVTTNLGAPSDDNLRTTPILDVPNVVVSTSTNAATNVGFNIKDGTDHVITATRTNKFEIRWFKFTVNPAVPTGACCSSSGSCSQLTSSDCIAITDAVYHGNDTTCAGAPCLLGACCLYDTTCSAQFPAQCVAAGGLHLGEGVACPALACHIELEPNSTWLEANEVTLASGEAVRGRSTGNVTVPFDADLDSADYFRVKTTAAAPGIYHHVLTLSSLTPTTNGISIRGFEQAPTLPGTWPGPVGSATATEITVQPYTPVGNDRVVQWYGFGKQEQVSCRVGGSGTLSLIPYAATLTSTPVVPMNLGAFYEGQILITTGNSGHLTDTALRVFDSNYSPIDGYANDNASIYGGSPSNSGNLSFLLRQYAPGTYYLAITASGLATDQGTPCDDNRRDGAVLDFPNAVVSADTSTATDVSFIVYDGTFHQFPASRGGRAEVVWFTFTVTPAPATGVCCRGTTCNASVAQVDCTAGPSVGTLFVITPTSTCNSAGITSTPCCYADFNKNGSMQVQDIFDFLNAWFAGSPFAKVGGDGVSASLAISDIFDFLNAWFAGC